MMATRFWRNPFVADAPLQHVVERVCLPNVGMTYVAGEVPRLQRTVVVHYSGGHMAYESVPA